MDRGTGRASAGGAGGTGGLSRRFWVFKKPVNVGTIQWISKLPSSPPSAPCSEKQHCSGKETWTLLCLFHVCDTMIPSFFQSVSTHQGCVHYFIFKLAFGESDRGAKTLGNSRKKTCSEQGDVLLWWNKRKKSKDGGIPGGLGLPLALPQS